MERITSRQNPFLKQIGKLNNAKSERRKAGVFPGEGPKLLEEAVKSGWKITATVSAEGVAVPAIPGARQVEVPREVLESLCDTKTPQGVLFLCELPETKAPEKLEGSRYLVLDGVQDPGNVGTIWRTADAFGCDGLILLSGCADPYSPKTVRASMGAVFRSGVWTAQAREMKAVLERSGIPLYGAALRDDTLDARDVDYSRSALAIGSEGRGLSEEMLLLCDKTIRIPMAERCESLNAAIAAAVLLWEAYR